jgi:3',5'-cyclic AMP phosphodiesterase CpdA
MTDRCQSGDAGEPSRLPSRSSGSEAFTLAHLSDLHATEVELSSPRDILSKRALGWVSWRRKRRKEHLREVLEALIEDLHACAPDHVGVTGDLTHLGLPGEIEAAVHWLERLGPPEQVSIVPGNHDAYAGAAGAERWAPWRAYMGDAAEPEAGLGGEPATLGFPWVRRIGEALALVGVSSARPTAPLLATGAVGEAQRARLEKRLAELAAEGRTRVVLMHHPPLPAGQSRRRQLDDAEAVRALLARAGAELLLHGHTHESHLDEVPGPHGPIPVIGVPSSSSIGHRPARRARYHLYRIEPARGADGAPRCRLSWQVRGFDRAGGRFVAEGDERIGG